MFHNLQISRRQLLAVAAALSIFPSCKKSAENALKISLGEWSLRETIRSGKLKHLDFPEFSLKTFGIEAIEYSSRFFESTKRDYLQELRQRCDDNGIFSLLILCGGMGSLADADATLRSTSMSEHKKWIEVAQFLGCHSIRVNLNSELPASEHLKIATESLQKICADADLYGINILVENHGGNTSNGTWIKELITQVNCKNFGTLPDFGNFDSTLDRYKEILPMLPAAKAICAKTIDFDTLGNETFTDFSRMLQMVQQANYSGYIGIEYEGKKLSEVDGIHASKALLEKTIKEI
jgi:L-ribulose-5-phosphate 3-epimerase